MSDYRRRFNIDPRTQLPYIYIVRALLAYLSLIRIPNCLIASAAVAVGQYLSPSAQGLPLNRVAMAAAFFVCGFGNIVNDILDIKSDAVNHPRRPLPSRKVTVGGAKALAAMFLLISLGLACFLNAVGLLIVTIALVLLTLYNVWLKHTAFGGNIIVAFLGGVTFVFGASSAGFAGITELPGAAIAGIFAFLMHFVREIIKDVQDSAGDKAVGSGTGPVKTGIDSSLILASVVFGILICMGAGVYYLGWFNKYFLILSIAAIYLPGIGQFLWLTKSPDSDRCRVVSTLLKIEMLPGIVALLVGKSY